jgi:hypothetical protein
MMMKQNNTKTYRKCATVRSPHFDRAFDGGVPSLMEKIPNHLGNESMCNFGRPNGRPKDRVTLRITLFFNAFFFPSDGIGYPTKTGVRTVGTNN